MTSAGKIQEVESKFAGVEIEFVSASSLFSPNKNIWLEGSYVYGRSAGNYLAGVNASKAGVPELATMVVSGQLHDLSPVQIFNSPYYGEIPYAGSRIEQGVRSVKTPSLLEILSRP